MTAPLNNLTDTWNNAGTTFTGLKYNITNTNSAAGSLMFDFQIAGSTIFSCSKAGALKLVASGTTTITQNATELTTNNGFGCSLALVLNNTNAILNGRGGALVVGSAGATDVVLGWELDGASFTTHFGDEGANNFLALRNSTSPNTIRVYNTFTDASNYERGVFDWTTSSNVLTIGTQNAGTGSGRDINFVPASGVAAFVNPGITVGVIGTAGNSPRIQVRLGTDTSARINFGLNSSDNPAFGFGPGGSTARDTFISRSAAGVLAFGITDAADAGATILAKTKAGAFVAGDIPSGTWAVCRDTSGATTKVIYNNAGTLLTVALV